MTTVTETAPFDLGRVPPATFGVLGRNFVNFFSMAIVLVGIPTLATTAVTFQMGTSSMSGDLSALPGRALVTFVSYVVALIGTFLLQAAVVTGTVSDLNGQRIGVGQMIDGRLAMVLPLFGLAILQGIAQALGFLLLIVPGLILATMWLVTVPALVLDKSGVFGAFTRSADLTRGHRWPVFGLMVAFWIGIWVVSAVFQSLFFGFGGAAFSLVAANRIAMMQSAGLGFICYSAAYSALTQTLAATGVAVVYFELRRSREGVAPQALIDTFS